MSASEIRSAIHIRTGQRAHVEAVDAWLLEHQVPVTAFADAYGACVHLLLRYSEVPELAVVGLDWLTSDEMNIVAYIRQTWPQTAIVIYGGDGPQPAFDVLPLTQTYTQAGGLQALVSAPPLEIVRKLHARASVLGAPPPPEVFPQVRSTRVTPLPRAISTAPAEREPPRSILTADELNALFDTRGED